MNCKKRFISFMVPMAVITVAAWTFPHDIFADGRPIRGARSLGNGTVPVHGLIDVAPGTRIIMTSFDGEKGDAQVFKTF